MRAIHLYSLPTCLGAGNSYRCHTSSRSDITRPKPYAVKMVYLLEESPELLPEELPPYPEECEFPLGDV